MEFENLQIEVPVAEDDGEIAENVLNPAWEKKYHNRAKGFVVGLDLSTEDATKRRENRAKRFGFRNADVAKSSSSDSFSKIDLNGIEFPKVPEADLADERPEALHIYGVSNMSTKDVFEYFKNYGPDTMEWIDDHSCNVVWETESMANTALKAMSRSYEEIQTLIQSTDGDISLESSDDIEAKDIWRIGKPHKKARCLFLRKATTEDKKLPGAAKRSLYYLVHGNGRGSKQGIVSSSRKRRMEHANTFIKESVKSKNSEVQFLSVSEEKKSNEIADEVMDVDDDDSPIPWKKSKDSGKLYSDKMEESPEGKGILGKMKKDENLRIEISNTRSNSKEWTSSKRNQHRRGEISSSDGSDEDDSSSNENTEDRATEKSSKLSLEKTASNDNTSSSEDDLRDQINSTDLRAKIDGKNSQEENVTDLRNKLHQKKKHLGLTKEQLNLCIEVTEVSDED